MTDLYKDFEKRFTNAWFSAGWAEVENRPQEKEATRKDLATLEAELAELEENMDNIIQKQLRLSNLASFYQ